MAGNWRVRITYFSYITPLYNLTIHFKLLKNTTDGKIILSLVAKKKKICSQNSSLLEERTVLLQLERNSTHHNVPKRGSQKRKYGSILKVVKTNQKRKKKEPVHCASQEKVKPSHTKSMTSFST